MLLKKTKLISIISCFIMLMSCDEKPYFHQFKELDSSWKRTDSVGFNFEVIDSTSLFNLYINTRVSNEYPFNNLFIITELTQPNNKVIVDTLEYEMTNNDGTLLGTGFSDIKESLLSYKENYKFDEKGKYFLSITQAVRETGNVEPVYELKGMTEIGLTIEKNK